MNEASGPAARATDQAKDAAKKAKLPAAGQGRERSPATSTFPIEVGEHWVDGSEKNPLRGTHPWYLALR